MGKRVLNNKKIESLADIIIELMIRSGLNYDQMLEALQNAREKYEALKTQNSQPKPTTQNEQTSNTNPHPSFEDGV